MTQPRKIAVVTGAAGNLGRAVAARLGSLDIGLILVDLDPTALRDVAPAGPDVRIVAADLTDIAALLTAWDAACADITRIDILCNIAGGFQMGDPVHGTSFATWDHLARLNVGTLLNASAVAVPLMLDRPGGRIVNIAAGAALAGTAGMGAYAATKSAVIRLTESMSAELRPHRINVNCVLPDTLDTPANRAAMPDVPADRFVPLGDVADLIAFLAGDAARAGHAAAIPARAPG